MLRTCLAITIIIGTTLNAVAAYPKRQIEDLQLYLPIDLTVEVDWSRCGTWNGFYYYEDGHIELCEENLALPAGAARMLFLHELGHAYTYPEDDFERWGGNFEDAADEFATIMSIAQGRPEDLLALARVWDDWAKENPPIAGDEHSPASERARRLREIYWGYKTQFGPGFEKYVGALHYWKARFLATEHSRGLG